jgi:hypothetical protein
MNPPFDRPSSVRTAAKKANGRRIRNPLDDAAQNNAATDIKIS